MSDRIDRRDKHQPPVLIKTRPNAMALGLHAVEQNHFEALLQGANDMPRAVPEQSPVAPSPLNPRFNAAPAGERQAEPLDEAEAGTARSPDDAFESQQQGHFTGATEAKAGRAPNEAADEDEDQDAAARFAAPETPETPEPPALPDPRVLSVRLKRKLQMEMKMREDATRAVTQEQAAAPPAQQLPPSGTEASSKTPPAPRVEGVGAASKADMARPTAPESPESPEMPEMPENEELSLATEPDEGLRQDRHHQSDRQEIVAAEAGAAQVVQAQLLAQRNMPESLPLHLLESI
ncbi:hypothetical protein H4CHR_01936 [Variovorax sp. PBS-H4]|uniref:hypothetical protein n=1 Tax=Variovorax sp. PBS-H4 TaxID=434008 RepID=UPI001318539D|nr:hypothetical protein [Variovorax sp. PBS-H4]VTU27148.1 hypothetical protein H4CHR_01936 [Variovorax sp. PBS-H4]